MSLRPALEGAESMARVARAPQPQGELPRLRRERASWAEVLQQEIDQLQYQPHFSVAAISRIEALARAKVADFKKTMRAHTSIARQVLQTLLKDRLVFTPERRGKQAGVRFKGEGSLWPLLSGTIPELGRVSVRVGTSPTGSDPILRREYVLEIEAA
jgi:hypothetical protein